MPHFEIIGNALMITDRLLKIGIIGAAMAALCCFTPVLVVLFAALGLAAWVAYVDMVLIPSLLFFLALIIFSFVQKDKGQGNGD